MLRRKSPVLFFTKRRILSNALNNLFKGELCSERRECDYTSIFKSVKAWQIRIEVDKTERKREKVHTYAHIYKIKSKKEMCCLFIINTVFIFLYKTTILPVLLSFSFTLLLILQIVKESVTYKLSGFLFKWVNCIID